MRLGKFPDARSARFFGVRSYLPKLGEERKSLTIQRIIGDSQ